MDKEEPRLPLSSDERRTASSHPDARSTAAAYYAKKRSAPTATEHGSPQSATGGSHVGSFAQTPPRSGSVARGTTRQGSPQRAHWSEFGTSAYDNSSAPPLRISTTTPPESPPSSFDARSAGRSRSSGRSGSNSGGGAWRGGSLDRPPTTARSTEDLGRSQTLPRQLPSGNPSSRSGDGRGHYSPTREPSAGGASVRGASPARSDRSEESTATFAFAQGRHTSVPAVRRGYPFQSSLEPTSSSPARGSSVSRSHSHGRPPLGPSSSGSTTPGNGGSGVGDKKASLGFGSRLQAETALVDDRGLLTHAKPFLRKGQGTNVSTLHGFNHNDTRRTASVDRGSVHTDRGVATYSGSLANNFTGIGSASAGGERRGSSVGRGTTAYFDGRNNNTNTRNSIGGGRVPSPPSMTALRSTRAPSLDSKITSNKVSSRPHSGSVGAYDYPHGDFSALRATNTATSTDQVESRPFHRRGSSESRAYSQRNSSETRGTAAKHANEEKSAVERLRGGSLGRYQGNARADRNASPAVSSSSSSGGGGSASGRGDAKTGSQSVSVLRRKLDDLNEFYQASVGSSRTASPGGSSVHAASLAAPASPDTASPRNNDTHHFGGNSSFDVGPLLMERVPHPASSAAAKARYHASRSSSPTSSVRSNELTGTTTNSHPPISNALATATTAKRHSLPRRPSGASTGADGNGLSGNGPSTFSGGGGAGRGRGADQRRITASISSTKSRNDTRKLAALAAAKRHASSMPRSSTTSYSSSSSTTHKGPTPKPKEPSPARGSEAYLESNESLASATNSQAGDVKRIVLPSKPPPSSRNDLVGAQQGRYEVETVSADGSCFGADNTQAKRNATDKGASAADDAAVVRTSKVSTAAESKHTTAISKPNERDGCAEVRHHPRYREFYFMRWKLGLDPAIVAQQMQQIGLDPEVRAGILFSIFCHAPVHV